MIETQSREGDPDRRKKILWAIEKKLAMIMRGRSSSTLVSRTAGFPRSTASISASGVEDLWLDNWAHIRRSRLESSPWAGIGHCKEPGDARPPRFKTVARSHLDRIYEARAVASQFLERPQAWYTTFGVKQFFFRIFSPAGGSNFPPMLSARPGRRRNDRGPPLAAIVAVNVAECPFWVTGGKTPREYIFSELPQVADIARSAFHDLANPSYRRSLRSGSKQFQGSSDPTMPRDHPE
jgi:hypothetical protein